MMQYLIPAAQAFLAIALLLVAILCLRLDGKLKALREGKDGVAQTARELAQAVGRAEAAIKALRAHTDEAADILQKRVEEANAVADGLKFLATTAKAMEPPTAPIRDERWTDDSFKPARRDLSTPSRWTSLR